MGLRFEVGPGASVHSPLATQNGFLRFLLRGCDLELFTSVLNGLGPFLEDEEAPVVVPMQIELLDSSITLKVRGTLVSFLDSVVAVSCLSPLSIICPYFRSREMGGMGKDLNWGRIALLGKYLLFKYSPFWGGGDKNIQGTF